MENYYQEIKNKYPVAYNLEIYSQKLTQQFLNPPFAYPEITQENIANVTRYKDAVFYIVTFGVRRDFGKILIPAEPFYSSAGSELYAVRFTIIHQKTGEVIIDIDKNLWQSFCENFKIPQINIDNIVKFLVTYNPNKDEDSKKYKSLVIGDNGQVFVMSLAVDDKTGDCRPIFANDNNVKSMFNVFK